jgi:hypothetical protein
LFCGRVQAVVLDGWAVVGVEVVGVVDPLEGGFAVVVTPVVVEVVVEEVVVEPPELPHAPSSITAAASATQKPTAVRLILFPLYGERRPIVTHRDPLLIRHASWPRQDHRRPVASI